MIMEYEIMLGRFATRAVQHDRDLVEEIIND